MGFLSLLSNRFVLIGVIILFIVSSLGIASCNKKRSFNKNKTIYKEKTIQNEEKATRDVQDVETFNKFRDTENKKFVPKKKLTDEEKEIQRKIGRKLHFINQRNLQL